MNIKNIVLCVICSLQMSLYESAAAESRILNIEDKTFLLDSILSNPSFSSMDIIYEKKIIVPNSIAKINIDIQENKIKELGKMRNWGATKFVPIGFFDSKGDYVVYSKERVRIEGLKKIRKDITYFSGNDKSSIKRKITNIYTDESFYEINENDKNITVFKKPAFESINPLRFLSLGKLIQYFYIVSDIHRSKDPNYLISLNGTEKKEYFDNDIMKVDGRLSRIIECYNINKSQKEYTLYLDPNDLSIIHKIVWYDMESGKIKKIHEYKRVSLVNVNQKSYPRVINFISNDSDGNMKQKEVINILQIETEPFFADELLQINSPRYKDYKIIDNRFSLPANTIDSVD